MWRCLVEENVRAGQVSNVGCGSEHRPQVMYWPEIKFTPTMMWLRRSLLSCKSLYSIGIGIINAEDHQETIFLFQSCRNDNLGFEPEKQQWLSRAVINYSMPYSRSRESDKNERIDNVGRQSLTWYVIQRASSCKRISGQWNYRVSAILWRSAKDDVILNASFLRTLLWGAWMWLMWFPRYCTCRYWASHPKCMNLSVDQGQTM